MTLAVNLRELRINRGLSLRDAAKQMGLKEESILRNAEKGNNVPLPRNAYKIAKFYGYQVTEVWPEQERLD
jgi:transcriptional regulator with XRE-family HTH domain